MTFCESFVAVFVTYRTVHRLTILDILNILDRLKILDNISVIISTKTYKTNASLSFHLVQAFSTAEPRGGGHFHINLYETCRFSGYHFSAQIPEQDMKIDQKFQNRL